MGRLDDAARMSVAGADEGGILVLCTANVCRSVMAAALLGRRLATLGVTVPVRSAGMLSCGDPPLPEVVTVMASYGIDAAAHRSRVASAAELARSVLVLGMTREHLRHAVVTEPLAWPRVFTLKEIVRRGELIGPRRAGEPLTEWLSRVHCGRDRAALLGDCADDDVADPSGGSLRAYAGTAALLNGLVTRLAALGWAGARQDK
jgi:protein-tyrosine phosphatase